MKMITLALALGKSRNPNMRDYRQIADLHISNLDQSFLSSLGSVFLSELYRAMDKSDSSSLIYETAEGIIVGFVTGGTSMGSIYKAMFPRIMFWGVPLALQLLSLRRIGRVVDILRYTRNSEESSGSELALPQAELFSIAVSPSVRGKGIAQKLYTQLIEDFKNKGIESFRIVVGKDLEPAHKFYVKMGAEVAHEMELHSGETSKVYIHNILL